MSKFDTSRWKEFKIGDLFDIKCSKYHDPKYYNDGEIPYIARTTFDNGVIKYISTDENLYEANCIIIGAESAKAFYQSKPFLTGNKIYRLYLKDKFGIKFNQNLALFFCSLINIAGEKYTYTNAFVSNKVESEFIKLPITKNGEIDFEYMETTIKNTKFQMQNILNAYKSLIQRERERESKIWNLDFSSNSNISQKERDFLQGGIMQIATHLLKNLNCEWREFNLTELFDIVLAKGDLQPKKLEKGDIPLVSAGNFNNGIAMYINGGDGISEKFDKNCISVDMFGKAFYQNNDFYAVSHGRVNILLPKFELNKFIAMFFIAILNSKLFGKYSFSTMCSQSKLTKEKISLPIDKFSNPNFEIMENFIKEIEKNHTSKLLAYYHKIMANGGGTTKFNLTEYLNFNPNLENKKIVWREFAFKDLFENIKQGARLKSADHIKGNLPFVMAGNINLGISGYIGNENVRKFSPNAITIDIFGNTFYRDYEFGASDDVGVFWNDKNPFSDNVMIFVASIISKFMQGKFDFTNKLRASQTHNFKILLPTYENGKLAFDFMENFIKAVQKESIKNVVLYNQTKLNAYKKLITS